MNKRILSLCLALALCLSLMPAGVFAAEPTKTYTELPTGVKATDISMMANGFGSFKIKSDTGDLLSKGVIAPNGNVIVERTQKPGDPPEGGINVSTHYAAAGSTIIDLQTINVGGESDRRDIKFYTTGGDEAGSAVEIIRAYEKLPRDAWLNVGRAYFGIDGYLTVFIDDQEGVLYAYIIDPQAKKVLLKQLIDEHPNRMGGETWNITSVNEGLIGYDHGVDWETDAGFSARDYISAGWMDINGAHKLSIDIGKYGTWMNFTSGLARVTSRATGLYGYLDKNGSEAIPCIYRAASEFKGDYAYVQDQDYRYGYIDTKGKVVVPLQYNGAYGYGEGLFTVGYAGQYDNYYGMVDINGSEIVPIQYTDITIVKNDVAYAVKDGEIVTLMFKEAEPVPDDTSDIFPDVRTSAYYYDAVKTLVEKEIIKGFDDGTFRPDNTITRAQMASMLVKANGISMEGKTSSFPDVPSTFWGYPAISAAAEAGYLSGYTDGTFGPNDPITYNEALTMIVNSLGYKASDLTGGYPDAFTNKAGEIGILNTVKTTGKEGCTRADTCCFLVDSFEAERP